MAFPLLEQLLVQLQSMVIGDGGGGGGGGGGGSGGGGGGGDGGVNDN